MSTKKTKNGKTCKVGASVNMEVVKLIEGVMKRKKIALFDLYNAFSFMIRMNTIDTIITMRKQGASIRKIARHIHMDDRRVAQIVKEYVKQEKVNGRLKATCGKKPCVKSCVKSCSKKSKKCKK